MFIVNVDNGIRLEAEMKKKIGIILIAFVLFVILNQVTGIVNDPPVQTIDVDIIVTAADSEYLNDMGYLKSEYFNSYYENTELNSGIAIANNGITINQDITVDGYDFKLYYETNSEQEAVYYEVYQGDQKVGAVSMTDIDKISEIALNINQDEYIKQIDKFIRNSQDLVKGLTGNYQFKGWWGSPIQSEITFYDYISTGEIDDNGYESCEIINYDQECYTKDDNLYLSDDKSNAVILQTDDYSLGYQKALTTDLSNGEKVLNTILEVKYEEDYMVQTYLLYDKQSLEQLQLGYQAPIEDGYELVIKLYNQFEADFNHYIE